MRLCVQELGWIPPSLTVHPWVSNFCVPHLRRSWDGGVLFLSFLLGSSGCERPLPSLCGVSPGLCGPRQPPPPPWPELVWVRNARGMGCAGSTVTEPGSVCCWESWAPRVMRREGAGQDPALVLPCPPPHYPDLLRCNELNHSTSLFHIRGDL